MGKAGEETRVSVHATTIGEHRVCQDRNDAHGSACRCHHFGCDTSDCKRTVSPRLLVWLQPWLVWLQRWPIAERGYTGRAAAELYDRLERKDVKDELRQQAFDLWLACHIQEEIAEAVGYSQRGIADFLKRSDFSVDAGVGAPGHHPGARDLQNASHFENRNSGGEIKSEIETEGALPIERRPSTAIGAIVPTIGAQECANYLRHAGYASI